MKSSEPYAKEVSWNDSSVCDSTLVAGNAANELLVNTLLAIVENASVCAGSDALHDAASGQLPYEFEWLFNQVTEPVQQAGFLRLRRLIMADPDGRIKLFVERNISRRSGKQQCRAAMVKNRLHRLAHRWMGDTGRTVYRH
jgi:hypothetical protein